MHSSLLSIEFLSIAVLAVVALTLLRGSVRALAFLALNLVFVWTFLGTVGTVSTALFCLLGFGIVRIAQNPDGLALRWLILGYLAIFAIMRQYELVTWALPEMLLTDILATAGLSFLLFKVLHLAIEARSGTLGPIEPLSYLNYCFNFTAFLMGPIQRFPDYRAQWNGETKALPLTFEAHFDAVLRILVGFVKATVLAVWFEPRGFQPDTELAGISLIGWLVNSYCFYFYLYLNFSGYCDVVIGVGSLMGVRPPENFDKPFLARNISDFWQRQHRSLTLWLTDYVFAPFYKRSLESSQGERAPLWSANSALLVTMLVSGLWHGTTLAFLLFGVAHGLYQVIYRTWDTLLTRRLGRKGVRAFRKRRWVHVCGVFLTFHATAFAFVFFRVEAAEFMRLAGLWIGAD